MKHFGDITKLSGYDLPPVDIIVGGSPCQDLSVAGGRSGLAGERSGLFMEQIRIVKEMRKQDEYTRGPDVDIRPRYMVWENVPGAFSSNRGADFQTVLSEIVRIADPSAPDVPMPQKGRWPKSGMLYDDMGGWSIAWRLHDAQFWGVPQRRKRIALVADLGGLSALEILFERKGLRGNTQAGRDQRKAGSGSSQAGTAGPHRISTYRKTSHAKSAGDGQGWEETSVSDTLNIYDNGESRTPTLVVYENHSQDSRYRPLGDVCESISAKYGTGGNNQPLVVCIGNGQADLNTNITEDLAQPLNCMHDQQIILGSEQSVRRLTPLECERLQGFPDGWTNIGEWIDSKGRARQTTDSARYKALGNSIALPFWQYLARRIVAQYEHDVTMASLFDGIGGFPLVFERSGARAVWASEIEDFPIAVTKKHFPEEAKQ